MTAPRKVRIIEPQTRPGRPLSVHIKRFPLLGPITLATILSQRGFDAAAYNENLSGPLEENAEAWADVCSADVVGISIMTATAPRGYALAARIRKDAPGVTIAFGGVHATFLPEEALPHGDVVCCGEGETVIEQIAEGTITSGIVRPDAVPDLDVLPTPDFALLRDFDKLVADYPRKELIELPIMTSRGCPYGCTYCSVTWMFGHKIRRRSVARVHEDLKYYAERGFRSYFFYDDNFTSHRDWTKQMLDRMRPMRVRFMSQSRTDFFWKNAERTERDDELLTALRRSACSAFLVGYETIDADKAKAWHKGYRGSRPLALRLAEDTRILHDQGVWVHGMFIIGPQHTQDDIDRTLEFVQRCKMESMQFAFLTPFPGTPLYKETLPHIFLDQMPDDWKYFDGSHVVYDHTRMGLEATSRAVFKAHCKFYRFGGWSLNSLKIIAHRPISAMDKLTDFVTRFTRNAGVFGQWRREMEDYFAFARSRTDGRDI